MRSSVRIGSLFALVAVLMLVLVAASPSVLPQPGQPTASPTANAGELRVTWRSSPGAQFYLEGWANREEVNRMTSAGRDWLGRFSLHDDPCEVHQPCRQRTCTGYSVFCDRRGAECPVRFQGIDVERLVPACNHGGSTRGGFLPYHWTADPGRRIPGRR